MWIEGETGIEMISQELWNYALRMLSALLGFGILLALIPRKLLPLRIFVLIWLFVLIRDGMTPAGLWRISYALEIRFVEQPMTLIWLALSSLVFVAFSHFYVERLDVRKLWIKRSVGSAIGLGLVSGLAIAVLPFLFRRTTNMENTPGPDSVAMILAVFALTFVGNLLEETLFRANLQNWLSHFKLPSWQVILLSGATFSLGHVFLSFTVTNLGWPILAFTFYEGVICAYLRERTGLLAAVTGHGLGIFLVATGFF